jgi:hypothetical protein
MSTASLSNIAISTQWVRDYLMNNENSCHCAALVQVMPSQAFPSDHAIVSATLRIHAISRFTQIHVKLSDILRRSRSCMTWNPILSLSKSTECHFHLGSALSFEAQFKASHLKSLNQYKGSDNVLNCGVFPQDFEQRVGDGQAAWEWGVLTQTGQYIQDTIGESQIFV